MADRIIEQQQQQELSFRRPESPPLPNNTAMVLKIAAIALLYYPLSIGLTFYQKWFLQDYKLPLLVVCGHYIIKWFAAVFVRFCMECCGSKRQRVSFRDQLRWLAPIGICASLDIGLSNWSLEYVTVSLYTMAKSSSIIFIVAFSLLLKLERWRPALGVEAALIAGGLLLFTWRSAQLDVTGLTLVELSAACNGIRWAVSQLVMQREDQTSVRHPLDMVTHVQPWMLIPIVPLIYIFESGELSTETVFSYRGDWAPLQVCGMIAIGGIIAFLMELAEYLLLVNTSGITLNLFGIVKEVFTLLLAHLINHDIMSPINSLGLLLCLTGLSIHSVYSKRFAKAKTNFFSGMALHGMTRRKRSHAHSSHAHQSSHSSADDSKRLLEDEEDV